MATYHVLVAGAYADTQADYVTVSGKDEAERVAFADSAWRTPGAHVFHGDRSPWDEHDAYPDWSLEHGPRGGIRWERA